MTSLQSMVDEFNKQRDLKVERHCRLLDLASEVGEVCKLGFSEGVGKKVDPSKWQEELGDVLYSLLSLMSDMNVNSEKALALVLGKYELRLKQKDSMESGG